MHEKRASAGLAGWLLTHLNWSYLHLPLHLLHQWWRMDASPLRMLWSTGQDSIHCFSQTTHQSHHGCIPTEPFPGTQERTPRVICIEKGLTSPMNTCSHLRGQVLASWEPTEAMGRSHWNGAGKNDKRTVDFLRMRGEYWRFSSCLMSSLPALILPHNCEGSVSLSSFYRWRNWGSEKSMDLPRTSQLSVSEFCLQDCLRPKHLFFLLSWEKGRQGSRAHSYPGAVYGTPRWHPNIWGRARVVTPRTQGMVFKQSQSHTKILNPLPSRKAQNPNDFSEENSHNNDEEINTNENWKPKGNNVEMMVEKMDLVPIYSLWAFEGPLEQSKRFVVSIRSKSRVWNANSGWWGGEGGHFSCPERPGKLNSSVSRNPVNSSVPGNLAGGSECIKKWLLFKPQAWSCGILRSTFESRWGPGEDGISSRFVWNEVAVCPSNDIRCPDMTAISGEGYLCKQKAYK